MARAQTNIAGLDAVLKDLATAKGQVFVVTGAGQVDVLTPGANGDTFIFDSTTASGLKTAPANTLTPSRIAAVRSIMFDAMGF